MNDLNHIKEKVSECISELKEATPGHLQWQHALFQMSYNLGRLSELTGEGRAVYDAVRNHVDCSEWDDVKKATAVFINKHSLPRISKIIGGVWTTDITEDQIESDCRAIFHHAQLRLPGLKLNHLEENGPGHASRYESAWAAIGSARKYLQEARLIADTSE